MRNLPLRKLVTILVDICALLVVIRAHVTHVDLPENATNVLITLIGAVNAAYFLSSSYEACHRKENDNHDERYDHNEHEE
jgi:hypothetical protein